MSSKSSNNKPGKVKKTDHESGGGGGGGNASTTPLVQTLLKENGVIRKIVEITSVSQTLLLLMTCKELHAAEKDVFEKHKLPVVCDIRRGWKCFSGGGVKQGNEFKLYRAMVGTPNSRWLKWLDTSEVEELKLPQNMMDEEMLIMFGGERFSELQTLDLCGCSNITDASVLEVARGCSNLQTLNLTNCRNITDASVMKVVRRCSNLQTLNLLNCRNITDASVMEVARRCSNLQTLTLYCYPSNPNITDTSVMEVARQCSNLQSLSLYECSPYTRRVKNVLRQSHPKLKLRG